MCNMEYCSKYSLRCDYSSVQVQTLYDVIQANNFLYIGYFCVFLFCIVFLLYLLPLLDPTYLTIGY